MAQRQRLHLGIHSFIHPGPLFDPVTVFEGNPNDYRDFPRTKQADILRQLQESLEPLNLRLAFMMAGRRILLTRNVRPLLIFAWTANHEFIWQKTEGEGSQSGHNWVHVGRHKLNVSTWMAMSLAEKASLLGIQLTDNTEPKYNNDG